jgi:hypothetical protein
MDWRRATWRLFLSSDMAPDITVVLLERGNGKNKSDDILPTFDSYFVKLVDRKIRRHWFVACWPPHIEYCKKSLYDQIIDRRAPLFFWTISLVSSQSRNSHSLNQENSEK